MKNLLFEFEDLPWFPEIIRGGGTDYLRFCLEKLRFYRPALPLLHEVLQHCGEDRILDLCSGGGGPLLSIQKELSAHMGQPIHVRLSDKYPNYEAFSLLKATTHGLVDFEPESLDAFAVPEHVPGVRTMFSAMHHFSEAQLHSVLSHAATTRRGVAFFDASAYRLPAILGILIFHPVVFFFCTPFFKPFRWSRILFTYLLPLIPLYTMWDGCISILRLHRKKDLARLVAALPQEKYTWKTGTVSRRPFQTVSYVIGWPEA